jgi:hypothetical protein
MKFSDLSTNEISEMSLNQVILHLIHREDFTDLEQVRVRDVYEKLFGDLPAIKSEQVSPPEPSMA